MRRRHLAGLLALTAAAGGCSSAPAPQGSSTAERAAAVAVQPPATPQPAASVSPVPPAGTVTVADGPFTDSVVLDALELRDGTLTGTVDVVSDVSELLALEVQVDAYDPGGALLGSARQVVDPEDAEEHHTTAGVVDLPLVVAAPGAASVVLSVPVLVNE